MKQEYSNLSKEELQKISLEKNKKGNATSQALKAQRILFHMGGDSFVCYSRRADTANDNYNYGNPDKFTKRFK